MNTVNALDQQVRSGLLQHDATGAQTHRADHVAIVFGRGEHNDAGRQGVKIDFLEHRQAVFVRHPQIQEQDIGLELGEHFDAFGAVLCFADDGYIFIGIKQFAEAIAENRVVVRKKDANLLFSLGHVNRAEFRWSDALHGRDWTPRSTRPPQYAYAP